MTKIRTTLNLIPIESSLQRIILQYLSLNLHFQLKRMKKFGSVVDVGKFR